MAKIVQIRRGSTDQHKNFPGEEGEITVDLTDKTIRVHDGTDLNGRATLDVNLPTGYPLARADMSNVAGSIGIAQLNFSDGNAGEVLQTDGNGNFSFTSQPTIPSLAMGGDLSGTVSNAQIVANAVGTTELADGAVTTIKLANTSVAAANLATNAVTTINNVDANVTETKLATNSVTTDKITDLNVTTAKIADDNITTAKIADVNVTTAKVADDAITNAKINGMASSKLTGALPALDGSSLTGLHYDMAFNAGYDADLALEDLEVATYGVLIMGRNGVFDGEVGHLETVALGAAVVIDIEKNGTTIYATKPQFVTNSSNMTAGVLDSGQLSFSSGDRITFKVTAIGSTPGNIGAGLRFLLKTRV